MSVPPVGPAVPTEEHLRLGDGRRLAFCTYGPAEGAPAFFIHGRPGSRLDFAANERAATSPGVRVIAVDRPGIGGSDAQAGRHVLDWPAERAGRRAPSRRGRRARWSGSPRTRRAAGR